MCKKLFLSKIAFNTLKSLGRMAIGRRNVEAFLSALACDLLSCRVINPESGAWPDSAGRETFSARGLTMLLPSKEPAPF